MGLTSNVVGDIQKQDRSRTIAWQVSLAIPCVLIGLASLFVNEVPKHPWQTVSGVLLLISVLAAAVTDIAWHRIPNWITYSTFGWALVINLASMFMSDSAAQVLGAVGLGSSLVGAFVPFFVMLIIFSMTGGGAGDVKLTAAIGALMGLNVAIDALLMSFVFAGACALVRGVWVLGPRNLLTLLFRSLGNWLVPLWIAPAKSEHKQFMQQPMPLGPSFAAGVVLVLLEIRVDHLLESISTLWLAT